MSDRLKKTLKEWIFSENRVGTYSYNQLEGWRVCPFFDRFFPFIIKKKVGRIKL